MSGGGKTRALRHHLGVTYPKLSSSEMLFAVLLLASSITSTPVPVGVRGAARYSESFSRMVEQELVLPTRRQFHLNNHHKSLAEITLNPRLMLQILERSSPFITQAIEGILTLPQEGVQQGKLEDAVPLAWRWLWDMDVVRRSYYALKPLLQDTFGSAAYGSLQEWLRDNGQRVRVSRILGDSVKTPELFLSAFTQPVLDLLAQTLLDEFIFLMDAACESFLNQTKHEEEEEGEFPGLMKFVCGLFPHYDNQGPPYPALLVDGVVHGIRTMEKVVRNTECLEKALCFFQPAREWLSYDSIKTALSIADMTRLLSYYVPQRLEIAFKTLSWSVKGELCCKFFACDITLDAIDDVFILKVK